MRITRGRVILGVAFLLLAAIAWSVYLVVQTARDLQRAQESADRLRAAVASGDASAREQAAGDFAEAAGSAHGHTGGPMWTVLTWAPGLGDDAAGVRALSESLDLVADDVLEPFGSVLDDAGSFVGDGRVDLERIEGLQQPLARARASAAEAAALVDDRDTSGYVGALRSRFEDYADLVDDLSGVMESASRAADVLPSMLGRDGPRTYLLVFQTNAEIRATGGLPGSWAELHADDGRLELTEQGSAEDFAAHADPVVPLTEEEVKVFGEPMGQYFQDPGFTPDFPRAAEVFDGFWADEHPDTPLDGVVAIDVVGMSYLLKALDPVEVVPGAVLTPASTPQLLLSDLYTVEGQAHRDRLAQLAARRIFDAFVAGPPEPTKMITALGQIAGEGRLLIAPFDDAEAAQLDGTDVAGQLASDDGATPHVDVALNSASASKMSYYLRYDVDLEALGCTDGVQQLRGTAVVSQDITPEEAQDLPAYVIGPRDGAGEQIVRLHLIGPYGGTVDGVQFDGVETTGPRKPLTLDGRPVRTAAVVLDSDQPVTVTWTMTTASGATNPTDLSVTPGLVSRDDDTVIPSAC